MLPLVPLFFRSYMSTVHTDSTYITLYIGPFSDSNGNSFYPATQNIDLKYYKDNSEVQVPTRVTPYRSGTYKLEFSTAGLAEGYYLFEAVAAVGELIATVKGNFELSWIGQEEYYITILRYQLFDFESRKHHLDVWNEGLYWNDMQLMQALRNAHSTMMVYKEDVGDDINILSTKYEAALLAGAMANALAFRDIYEVSEAHNYTDEVVFNINRSYQNQITFWEARFQKLLDQIMRERPLPISLKSPAIYSEALRRILSISYNTGIYYSM